MSEESLLFQYQVKSKTNMGIRYYYFYSNTDIEIYLNNKNIKYVRYTKDTALNKKERRIRELFNENNELRGKNTQLKSVLKEIREYCNTYTRLSAKELLEIIDKGIGE